MIPGLVGGFAVLAGVCGAAVVTGVLLLVAGLRRVPLEPRRLRWSHTRTRLRGVLGSRRTLSAACGAAVVGWVVSGWPVVAVAAAGAVAGAPRLLSASAVKRQLARLEALEGWTRRVADLLGSGAGGLEQAIGMSVRTCPPPIAGEVQALAGRLRVSGPEAALRGFADDLADIGSPAADLVAAALIVRVRRGGRGLRPVLDALAADVAELVRARRAIEADRARPRSNVRALVAITTVVLTVTLVFARDYLSPFTTPAGQVVLAAITGVFACGIWLLGRIARPPRTPRLLPAARTAGGAAAAAAGRGAARGAWWG